MITTGYSVRAFACALVLALLGGAAQAADVQVAVAANFTEPAKLIATAFEKKTGDHVALSFGASGQFYTQIKSGAPFEILLSADADRPAQAEKDGLAVPGTRFTYATGQLVLYSATPGKVDAKGQVLKTGAFDKLSVADPAVAPYGVAAMQTLDKLGVTAAVQPKIVKGASIGQAWQFVQSGAADVGFVALSQVINEKGGSRWIVPESMHAPIDQQAILLKTGADDPEAKKFLAFLKGGEARAIIKSYGYTVH